MLFIYNTDKPGVIGAIGTTIGKHNINIARMTVGQEKDRGQNIILLTTDTPVTPECLADVRALPQVASALPGTVEKIHQLSTLVPKWLGNRFSGNFWEQAKL